MERVDKDSDYIHVPDSFDVSSLFLNVYFYAILDF